ncbi:hypothetical protein VKT23_002717 [Stygiomarasmius scandens]|uniref:Uncharacterized protein n=1 Tax=Marasmiellus scandens TaxID=2682957 RepID=A0ABR1K378_9AGAR
MTASPVPPTPSRGPVLGLSHMTPTSAEASLCGIPVATVDFAQYAIWIANRNGLTKSADQSALIDIGQLLDQRQTNIMLSAHLLRLEQKIDLLRPSPSSYTLDETFRGHISNVCDSVILNPSLGAYMDRPNTKVIAIMKARPEWEMTSSILSNNVAMKSIKSWASSRITHHRNDFKETVSKSMGDFNENIKDFDGESIGIVELAQQVIHAIGGKSCDVEVSIPFCARVVLVRKVYRRLAKKTVNGKVAENFWKEVDSELEAVRTSKNNDKVKISRAMAKVLEDDCNLYGQLTELSGLPTTAPVINAVNVDED